MGRCKSRIIGVVLRSKHNLYFREKIWKMFTPVNPSFTICNIYITRTCLHDEPIWKLYCILIELFQASFHGVHVIEIVVFRNKCLLVFGGSDCTGSWSFLTVKVTFYVSSLFRTRCMTVSCLTSAFTLWICDKLPNLMNRLWKYMYMY